jgi:transposase
VLLLAAAAGGASRATALALLRSFASRDACAQLGIERRYTRPQRPQTNGKAEALVKTLLRE